MLQVTQSPQTPVLVQKSFTVLGIASTVYAGQRLSILVDGSYASTGPEIQADGTWQVAFLFQSPGNRRMRFSIGGESTEIVVPVVTTPILYLNFTQIPARLPALQSATIEGEAVNYANGTQLLLRADGLYELARPVVSGGMWRATIGFNQKGIRTLEILSLDGRNRDQRRLEVLDPLPRPPRVGFSSPPQQLKVEQTVTLRGPATDYADGAQLILRADQQFELARPVVQNQQWEANTGFRSPGNRLLEIIGSEQDRAQTIIEVVPNTAAFQILPRSSWTTTVTSASLPSLFPQRITIHHTALSSAPPASASADQDEARMRVIWNSHVFGNGWSDIGYHFIVMPSGRVFAARDERKRGAHDVINDGLGIAFDGIYSSATINQRQFEAAVSLCTLLCKRYGIANTVSPVPTATADFGTRNLPRILGHRDRVATECPGSAGGTTVRLNDIRVAVNNLL